MIWNFGDRTAVSDIRHISDRIAVMYLGEIVETGPTENVYAAPAHPYTKALLSAETRIDLGGPKRRILLRGEVPSPLDPPSGCRFRTRCWMATGRCRETPPGLSLQAGRMSKCHYAPAVLAGEELGATVHA